MRYMCVLGAAVSGLLFCACSTSEWVNTSNPNANYTLDYNACEMDMTKDPKLQQGNQYFLQLATERCMLKKGWVLRETP